MDSTPSAQQSLLDVGARTLVLLVAGVAAAWQDEGPALSGLALLALLWAGAVLAGRSRLPWPALVVADSVATACVVGSLVPVSTALLPALAVIPFVHGLLHGWRGTILSLLSQGVVLAPLLALSSTAPPDSHLADLATWLVTGLSFGLIANFFSGDTDDDTAGAYRQARELLSELNELSGRLDGGLDPASMAGAILDEVSAAVPIHHSIVLIERDGALLPLAERITDEPTDSAVTSDETTILTALAEQARRSGQTVVTAGRFAVALSSAGTRTGVLAGRVLAEDQAHLPTPEECERLAARLEPSVLRLDTAQLFVAFRDSAMAEERQRLAREMHDGMAQDIASMGYVVDALLDTATPAQAPALASLRSMITRVVAEVRRSVTTLRTDVGSSESLGAAIATLARHLSDASGIPIQVTVDERTHRLRHEVESELLRITQEAMNNAVKHAGATSIDVHCRVDSPNAEIVVTDNGQGLTPGRSDSHGLSIMRERAALINGCLDLESSPGHGMRVRVRVGPRDRATAPINPQAGSRD